VEEELEQMVVEAQRGQVGVGHSHLPWEVVEVALHPLEGEGVLHPLLQIQMGHVWLVAGQVASCPALAVAWVQSQTVCWVCFVMTAWPSCALPAGALLVCHDALLCCPSCKHMTQ